MCWFLSRTLHHVLKTLLSYQCCPLLNLYPKKWPRPLGSSFGQCQQEAILHPAIGPKPNGKPAGVPSSKPMTISEHLAVIAPKKIPKTNNPRSNHNSSDTALLLSSPNSPLLDCPEQTFSFLTSFLLEQTWRAIALECWRIEWDVTSMSKAWQPCM